MFKLFIPFLLVALLLNSSCKTAKPTSTNQFNSEKISGKQKHILDGNWLFVTIPGKNANWSEQFPNKFPETMFDISQGKISGYAGCNRFTARITVNGDIIKVIQPQLLTKTACETRSDNTFIDILTNINRFEVKDSFAHFYNNKFEMLTMKRVKK